MLTAKYPLPNERDANESAKAQQGSPPIQRVMRAWKRRSPLGVNCS